VLLELDVTRAMRGAQIRVLHGARTVFETQADLDPKVVYRKALDAAPAPLTVDVLERPGAVVLHHVEGEYDALPFDGKAKNPTPEPPSNDPRSEAGTLALGEYNEQRDRFQFAWHDYQAGLKTFPGSGALAKAAGRTAFVLNRYDDAIRLLAPLAASSAHDAEAAYYYGAALASAGRPAEGRTALASASQDPRWSQAARLQLALVEAREGDTAAAVPMIQALAAEAHAAVRTGALEVAILRRAGKADAAKQRLRFWQEQDPAENTLRFESSLVGGADDPALWSHLAADPERVLTLADLYLQLGAFNDALKLLERRYPSVPANEAEPGAVLPQEHPLVAYYRGFCRLKLGGDPGADFQAAGALSTRYIFPSRASSYPVLKAALAHNDADAVAHALLGNLYFHSLETDQAIAEWRKAFALKPELPALCRNLGRALLDIKGDSAAAFPVLLTGRRLDPENREIADALSRMGRTMPVAGSPRDAALSQVAGSALANRALVRSVLDPDGARGLFTADNFPKEKQPAEVRRAYVEVQLQDLLVKARARKCGEALALMEKLGAEDPGLGFTLYGFGAFMKPAHFQYYLGVIENACGAGKAAQKRWSKLSKASEPEGSIDYVFPLLAARRLGEDGVQSKIAAAVQAMRSNTPADGSRMDLIFAQGMLHLAAGHREEGSALLQKSATAADPLIQYLSLVALRDSPAERLPAR
jgi:tetratricopeptide (TPR) repeat protein